MSTKKSFYLITFCCNDRRDILQKAKSILLSHNAILIHKAMERQNGNFNIEIIMFGEQGEKNNKIKTLLSNMDGVKDVTLEYKKHIGCPTFHTIQLNETDKTDNVYNGAYLNWFDMARISFFEPFGNKYSHYIQDDVYSVITEANCRFKKPLRFHDEIVIYSKLRKKNKLVAYFDYIVCKTDSDAIYAKGYTKHVFINKDQKLIHMPDTLDPLYVSPLDK